MEHIDKNSKCYKEGLWKKQKVFFQVGCGTQSEKQGRTNQVGLLIVCLSIYGGYIFYLWLHSFLPRLIQINNEGVLMRIASAGQYTI